MPFPLPGKDSLPSPMRFPARTDMSRWLDEQNKGLPAGW
jgi:hypothetical protein